MSKRILKQTTSLPYKDFSTSTIIKPIFKVKYYSTLLAIIYLVLFLFLGNNSLNFISLSVGFFLVGYCIVMPAKIKEYKVTEFVIGEDKISYIRNWIDYKRTDIRYENIKEVVVRQNAIKKLFNLGDIYLISNISSNNAGITFFNIDNPEQVYLLIQKKINKV